MTSQTIDPFDGEVEQFARGRVHPMHVFDNDQNRPAPCQRFELALLRLEQHLTFALRAEVEAGVGNLQ